MYLKGHMNCNQITRMNKYSLFKVKLESIRINGLKLRNGAKNYTGGILTVGTATAFECYFILLVVMWCRTKSLGFRGRTCIDPTVPRYSIKTDEVEDLALPLQHVIPLGAQHFT